MAIGHVAGFVFCAICGLMTFSKGYRITDFLGGGEAFIIFSAAAILKCHQYPGYLGDDCPGWDGAAPADVLSIWERPSKTAPSFISMDWAVQSPIKDPEG